MGKLARMKFVLAIAVIALAVTCMGENSDGEEAFVQAAVKSIKEAKSTLLEMKPVEASEIQDMKRIRKDLEARHPTGHDIYKMTEKSVKSEDEQQRLAVKTRDELRAIIKSFKAVGLHEMLGESLKEEPLKKAAQKALLKLKNVEATLTSETSTFHSKHKIERMEAEAKELEGIPARLGEEGPIAELQNAAKVANFASKPPEPKKVASKGPEGAAALLAHLSTTAPKKNLAMEKAKKMKDLLMRQEAEIEQAEK